MARGPNLRMSRLITSAGETKWFARSVRIADLSKSNAAAILKPAAVNPRDSPPAPANRSIPTGLAGSGLAKRTLRRMGAWGLGIKACSSKFTLLKHALSAVALRQIRPLTISITRFAQAAGSESTSCSQISMTRQPLRCKVVRCLLSRRRLSVSFLFQNPLREIGAE